MTAWMRLAARKDKIADLNPFFVRKAGPLPRTWTGPRPCSFPPAPGPSSDSAGPKSGQSPNPDLVGKHFDALDGRPTHFFFVLGLKFEELYLPWLHKLSQMFAREEAVSDSRPGGAAITSRCERGRRLLL